MSITINPAIQGGSTPQGLHETLTDLQQTAKQSLTKALTEIGTINAGAGTVKDGPAGGDREPERVAPRVDHGDAGPGDAPAVGWCRLVAPNGRVAQPDLRHVEHRVGRAGRQDANPDSQVSNAGHRDSMPQ